MRAGRQGGLFLLLMIAASGPGCRAHQAYVHPGWPPPKLKQFDPQPVPTQTLEPDLSQLPTADPLGKAPARAEKLLGLTEQLVQCRAAAHAAAANLIDAKNARPLTVSSGRKPSCTELRAKLQAENLLRQVRSLAALEARNRAAADALERWLQLAEALVRRELVIASIATFDQLRELTPQLRETGLPALTDAEILRERAQLLVGLETLDAAIALLNTDLATQLGWPLNPGESFQPVIDLLIATEPPTLNEAIQSALLNRPELLLLRRLHQELGPSNLPAVRAELQSMGAGPSGSSTIASAAGARSFDLPRLGHGHFTGLLAAKSGLLAANCCLFAANSCGVGRVDLLAGICGRQRDEDAEESEEAEEVALRRAQLAELLLQREAAAEAEVQAALTQLQSGVRKVGLLAARARSYQEALAAARAAGRQADTLQLELDLFKARMDLIGAVVEWHRWRVRLKAAQGLLVQECLEAPHAEACR